MNMLTRLWRSMTRFEKGLWLTSVLCVSTAFGLAPSPDWVTLAASLIGVTALVFVAKGYVAGQVLTVVFAVFYGVISFFQRYYGEMITYLGMTSPIAILAAVEWYRHPYQDSAEVTVRRMRWQDVVVMLLLTGAVTGVFFFILRALGNASLGLSTVSVTTSFLASYLTFRRSAWYALAYASNDVVLIGLWVIASLQNAACIPMVVCFVMFLINDSYGFVNWTRMQRRQS